MVPPVSTLTSRPLRARNAEEKKKRRSEILRAAESLWLSTSYSDLSMSQVAREAQLAKGTLYLYFDTKEELFLALLSEQIEAWLKNLQQSLETGQYATPEAFTDFIVAEVLPQDSLRRMLVLLSTVIDPSLSLEQSQNFRRLLLRYVVPIVELMPCDRDTNLRILMHIYALSVGWHMAAQGPQLQDRPVFQAMSTHTFHRSNFTEEFSLSLRASIRSLIDGASTASQSA